MNDDLIMSNTPDTDYSQALAEGWLPIREVSRITGVNAVTLRAWERRYGLIVPHRTAKGHRLFSTEHIQRIQQILLWLNRGVSVSQIKPLLNAPAALAPAPDSDWQAWRQTMIEAISELAERRLDDCFNQAMSLYPARPLCEQLLQPLLNELDPGQSCRIYIRFSIDLTMGYGNGLDLICPLPLVAEDRDMLEEPGAPEYGAPAEYRVRLYGDTLLITETSFEQLEASTGYMFGAEKAVRFDVKVKRG